MCHPRNKTKVQTEHRAWIIACPQLQKHGMQLFSSHLCNRPRNTERLQKVFRCLCWLLVIRQHIWAHQSQLTSPHKNIKQGNKRANKSIKLSCSCHFDTTWDLPWEWISDRPTCICFIIYWFIYYVVIVHLFKKNQKKGLLLICE